MKKEEQEKPVFMPMSETSSFLVDEKISKIVFAMIGGGDKTFIIFESGKVAVLPISRTLKIQAGEFGSVKAAIRQIGADIQELKTKMIESLDQSLKILEE